MIFFGHLGITLLFAFIVFSLLKMNVDYRFVLVGAVLPDLIDKPIGDFILYSVFQNGRIFAHTLLFVAVLTMLGWYVDKKYRFSGILLLALGSMVHLALDQMWLAPKTLFWPLLGPGFDKLSLEDYAGYILNQLLHNPQAYVPEIIGVIILASFAIHFRLYRPDNAMGFLKSGRMGRHAAVITPAIKVK